MQKGHKTEIRYKITAEIQNDSKGKNVSKGVHKLVKIKYKQPIIKPKSLNSLYELQNSY